MQILEYAVCYQSGSSLEDYCDQYPASDWVVLFDYLFGLSDDFLTGDEFSLTQGSSFPLDSFPVEEKDLKVFLKTLSNPAPCHLFFYGRPGTGKTEFAKYIAQEMGKELLIKRMSDLQSMWVGETEKQIAEAFDEAEKEGAVLFLDEAALRRFTWKIKFLPLTTDGKEKLFRKYFQPKGRLSSEIRAALKEIRDLTLGDFKTVHQRQQYATEGASHLDNVKALKQEFSNVWNS